MTARAQRLQIARMIAAAVPLWYDVVYMRVPAGGPVAVLTDPAVPRDHFRAQPRPISVVAAGQGGRPGRLPGRRPLVPIAAAVQGRAMAPRLMAFTPAGNRSHAGEGPRH